MADLNTDHIDREVLPFLSLDARIDVKCIALQYFLGLTGTDEGRKFLGGNRKYLSAIISLKDDKQAAIAKDAYFSLINLSTDDVVSHEILDSQPSLIKELLLYVMAPESVFADPVCMILSNLSRSIGCATIIVQKIIDNSEEIGFDKIIQVFCMDKFNKCDQNLHYLGPFLSNLTQVKVARSYVLDKERCVIQRLIPFTQYKESKTRRGGIVGTLRNCCFETALGDINMKYVTSHVKTRLLWQKLVVEYYHKWLLSDSVDILPRLLLPLAGPEEFDDDEMEKLPDDLQYLDPDKEREPDPDIRKMLVEAVTKLCTLKVCRQQVKDINTYIIMRELHKWEEDPACRLAIENLVSLLISEKPEADLPENLNEVEIPEDIHKELDTSHLELQEQIEKDTKKLEEKKS